MTNNKSNNIKNNENKFTYYGWLIVALSFLTLSTHGSASMSFSLFQVALIDEYGWSRGALGGAFLISQMFEYFTLPFGLTDNLFASTFYALTGFHGLHVTLGSIMIMIIWTMIVIMTNPLPLWECEYGVG